MNHQGSSLSEELHDLLEGVAVGEIHSPSLVGTLELAATNFLQRRGIRGAQVKASMSPGGLRVDVRLPPGPHRVRSIVVQLT